jgi:hypothetical protein
MLRASEREPTRWLLVVLFAIGMAWVEAASVYYLRAMVDRVDPYQLNPLPIHGVSTRRARARGGDARHAAHARHAAGRTWRARLGYTAIAFGMWDILITRSVGDL